MGVNEPWCTTKIVRRNDFLLRRRRLTISSMSATTITNDASPENWQRAFEFKGEIAPSAARALLKLEFSERDQMLMGELAAKARTGTLTSSEQTILDTFEKLGCLLDIIHSKARRVLKKSF